MNTYEVNMKIIKDNIPRLYENLMDESGNETDEIKIESIETCESNNGLVVDINDKHYRINSIYYPTKEAEFWVEQFNFNNIDITVAMFGLGNGIFAEQILKNLDEKDKLIIYEPSKKIFDFVVHNYDLSELLNKPNFFLFVQEKSEFKKKISANTHWINIGSQIICEHPFYNQMFTEEIKAFYSMIRDCDETTFTDRNTQSHFGKSIVENTIRNLHFIKEASTNIDLKGKLPKDVPAIIVSAGPSLDNNIDKLKLAKGKSVIFATDTALKHLLARDIIPDFVVTLDAKKSPELFSDSRSDNIPMFCEIEANRIILSKHKAKKFLFSCHPYVSLLYRKYGKFISYYSAGGSVATGAFSICVALEFERIVLIGQDLAYANGVTHAGGEILNDEANRLGARFVEGNDGNMIKTRPDWYIYLRWFESSIEKLPEIEVINATEGGAKIQGTKIMNLDEVIDNYCNKNINCQEIIDKIEPTLDNEILKNIKLDLLNSISDLDKIKNRASKGLSYCNKIIKACKNNKFGDTTCQDMVKKIQKINSEFENKLVYQLIDTYSSDESIKNLANIYQLKNNEEEDRVNTFIHAKSVYEIIISAVKDIRPILYNEIEENFNKL